MGRDFNVNVMAIFDFNTIPCFLCGIRLQERTDKNQKPYFVCDPCGIQLFIRRKAGIERLKILKRNLRDIENIENPATLIEIKRILFEIDGIREEIGKLDSSISLIFPDDNQIKALKSLKKREQVLLQELEVISGKSRISK